MLQELKFQLSTAILTILTLAAGVSAFINFQQQTKFRLPEDGVIWADRQGAVEALYVKPNSPGITAGVHAGDHLLDIDGVRIEQATDVAKVLVRIGAWSKAKYRLQSRGVELQSTLLVAEQPLDRAVIYQYLVGSSYLLIGLFVYFRRGSAHKARHFYILCLASFISLCFHYTGQFNPFDKVMYFGNLLAGLLAPTLFLHFCLTFPEPRPWLRGRVADDAALPAGRAALPHLPGLLLGHPANFRAADRIALDARPGVDDGLDAALFHRRASRSTPNTGAPRTPSSASS